MAPALGALTALTRLDLQINSMDAEAAAALAPVIAQLSTLRELQLTCDLDVVQRAMAPAIWGLTRLTCLCGQSSSWWADKRRLGHDVWFSV